MNLKYEVLEEKLASQLEHLFLVKDAFVEVNPGNVLILSEFRDLGERITDLEVRPDDVWLVAHPRTGSTWALEMLWCMINNLDLNKALTTHLNVRCPLLELSSIFPVEEVKRVARFVVTAEDSVRQVEELPSPRCIRTHLPSHLLPQQISTVKPKVVYLARNPKDVCVSYYLSMPFIIDPTNCIFEEFADLFIQGRVPFGPYLDHVLGFWKLREEANVLFLKYEDLKKNYKATVTKLSKFLGKYLSEEEVESLMDHASFEKMQSNPAVNNEQLIDLLPKYDTQQETKFIRKGQVGDWRNHMSDELSAKFDRWMKEKLSGTGLSFDSS